MREQTRKARVGNEMCPVVNQVEHIDHIVSPPYFCLGFNLPYSAVFTQFYRADRLSDQHPHRSASRHTKTRETRPFSAYIVTHKTKEGERRKEEKKARPWEYKRGVVGVDGISFDPSPFHYGPEKLRIQI